MPKDYLRVRNWERYQHYKDRTPPWIKVYSTVLDDLTFASLPDSAKGQLVSLWVLASRLENRLPADVTFLSNKINASGPVDFKLLIAREFLESHPDSPSAASNMLATCYTDERREETDKSRVETDSADSAAGAALSVPKKRGDNGTTAQRAFLDSCSVVLGRKHTYTQENVKAAGKAAKNRQPEDTARILQSVVNGTTPTGAWCRRRLNSGVPLGYILGAGGDKILDQLAATPPGGYRDEAEPTTKATARSASHKALVTGYREESDAAGELVRKGDGAARGLLRGPGVGREESEAEIESLSGRSEAFEPRAMGSRRS